MIKIAKVTGGYTAHATPPDVDAEWHSMSALTPRALITELLTRGAAQIDIGNAFYEAEPNWLRTLTP